MRVPRQKVPRLQIWTVNAVRVSSGPRGLGKFYDELADSQRCDLNGALGRMEADGHLTHYNHEDPQVE